MCGRVVAWRGAMRVAWREGVARVACVDARGCVVKVLVAGGSSYGDVRKLHGVLDALHLHGKITTLAFGDSALLARLLRDWAYANEVFCEVFSARWVELGLLAGPDRNSWMLSQASPDLVVSLPGGGDLTGKAWDTDVPVVIVAE